MSEYTYRIERDESPDGPREWDNAGTFLGWHRHYTSPDPNPYTDPSNFEEERERIIAEGGVVLPVYAYEHGGIVFSTAPFSCPWDSGQFGWIYCDAETITREWSGDRDAATRCLIGEVETYSQWASGDVWGYVVERDGEHEDSCWGFYGYGAAESEARSVVEWCQKRDAEAEVFERLHCAS